MAQISCQDEAIFEKLVGNQQDLSQHNHNRTKIDKTKIDDDGEVTETERIEKWVDNNSMAGFLITGMGGFGGDDVSGTFTFSAGSGGGSSDISHTVEVDGVLTERDFARGNHNSSTMLVEIEALGDDWDLEGQVSGHNSAASATIGDLTTETVLKNQNSSSSSSLILTI